MIAGVARVAGWLCVAAVPAALAFAALAPEHWVQHVAEDGPPCFFRALTTVPCPFCNITHATMALGSGQFVQAFRYHPLVIPTLLLWIWAGLGLARFQPGRAVKPALSPGLLAALVGVLWAANLINMYLRG